MSETHTYTTAVRWTAERKGVISSGELPEVEVATPPEFPKGHPGIWSPEHLFVAAAEVCLMTTFLAIAENSKLAFSSYSSEAIGTLEKTESGFLVTQIVIKPRITITDPSAGDRAKRIIEKAEKYCLISNSMKTDVTIEPSIVAE